MTQSTIDMIRTHRLALSVSGGVALGAYEAGVLAQIYRDLYDFNTQPGIAGKARVVIDAIAGASAGSITGLILAQSVALGHTPDVLEERLRTCWISLLDIHGLLTPAPGEPAGSSLFTDNVIGKIIVQAVESAPAPPAEPQEPIVLWVTMTNLDGVPYVIDFSRKGHAQPARLVYAQDYTDYVPFLITGANISMIEGKMAPPTTAEPIVQPPNIWLEALEAARGSSAFPIAFPCRYQTRDLMQYDEYVEFKKLVESDRLSAQSGEAGLEANKPLPTEATFQFVDGGLFNNEPIGKAIDAVAYLNKQFPERNPQRHDLNQRKVGRSFVIVEPEPQLPADVEASLNDSVANANLPVLPTSILGKIINAYFNTALYGDFATAAQVNQQVTELNAALAKLDDLGIDPDKLNAIKSEIKQAVGLNDKSAITLQRVPHTESRAHRLAGSFAGHFGGFLRQDYREADFITGRYEARQWFAEWLTLWLKDHAADIDKTPDDITPDFILSVLPTGVPDPAAERIAPTNLTPVELAQSGWFPTHPPNTAPTDTQLAAALSKDQRTSIVQLGEERLEALLTSWFKLSTTAQIGEHIAAFALEHLYNGHLVNDPE